LQIGCQITQKKNNATNNDTYFCFLDALEAIYMLLEGLAVKHLIPNSGFENMVTENIT